MIYVIYHNRPIIYHQFFRLGKFIYRITSFSPVYRGCSNNIKGTDQRSCTSVKIKNILKASELVPFPSCNNTYSFEQSISKLLTANESEPKNKILHGADFNHTNFSSLPKHKPNHCLL